MSDENKMVAVLVVTGVFAVVSYIAFVNPPVGIAIGAGVAVATLVWKMLKGK
ncbi:hypothetical protein [Streptomyces heilongjiangensis]|uniref:Uncharacterized protein n=1 Tax=Streptomyces heilongjiangensis TaxID=945052 RepID=A0ABW1BI80_9ACTN|nr:hypothetical protein [Streptomyces heilongjiangensis]MDC2951082.1 hypothetical protein [Streptomyces heilongjiangensis]